MLTDQLSFHLQNAFVEAGYAASYGVVVKSNRPDLCQFQCNGAMIAAKAYSKAPFMICDEVIAVLRNIAGIKKIVKHIETVKPGFINIILTDEYLVSYINECAGDEHLGVKITDTPKTIVMDYGGPNIAKPLHVGHLRTAIIGEALKRALRFIGHNVIADVHIGDWGLQMGMIISEYALTMPELPYFDSNFSGDYPSEPPFTLNDLEEVYPRVSVACKADPERMELAKAYTYKLQNGDSGAYALWQHIVDVSVVDIKANYERLNVSFDLWHGESHASEHVKDVVGILESNNAVYESEGARVVDVTHADDKKEMPPMILFKTDGSILYSTTDLATIYQRELDYKPDNILYVVDNRQATHFTQVFRCAQDYGVVRSDLALEHIGFGTMNGKDGKPFKTRSGGTIKLSDLIDMVEQNAKEKIRDKEDINSDEISKIVGLATLKYADLSNFRSKDYVFDLDKFSSFEGKTGPYILYTYVRINNIINKLEEAEIPTAKLVAPASDVERDIYLKIAELPQILGLVEKDRAPNYICELLYDLASLTNNFYHNHHILTEDNEIQKQAWHGLLILIRRVLATNLDLLGIDIPEKM
jgi:arginyl-tRNA synthetase